MYEHVREANRVFGSVWTFEEMMFLFGHGARPDYVNSSVMEAVKQEIHAVGGCSSSKLVGFWHEAVGTSEFPEGESVSGVTKASDVDNEWMFYRDCTGL